MRGPVFGQCSLKTGYKRGQNVPGCLREFVGTGFTSLGN